MLDRPVKVCPVWAKHIEGPLTCTVSRHVGSFCCFLALEKLLAEIIDFFDALLGRFPVSYLVRGIELHQHLNSSEK